MFFDRIKSALGDDDQAFDDRITQQYFQKMEQERPKLYKLGMGQDDVDPTLMRLRSSVIDGNVGNATVSMDGPSSPPQQGAPMAQEAPNPYNGMFNPISAQVFANLAKQREAILESNKHNSFYDKHPVASAVLGGLLGGIGLGPMGIMAGANMGRKIDQQRDREALDRLDALDKQAWERMPTYDKAWIEQGQGKFYGDLGNRATGQDLEALGLGSRQIASLFGQGGLKAGENFDNYTSGFLADDAMNQIGEVYNEAIKSRRDLVNDLNELKQPKYSTTSPPPTYSTPGTPPQTPQPPAGGGKLMAVNPKMMGNLWFSRQDGPNTPLQINETGLQFLGGLNQVAGKLGFKPQVSSLYSTKGHSNGKGGEHAGGNALDIGLAGVSPAQRQALFAYLQSNPLVADIGYTGGKGKKMRNLPGHSDHIHIRLVPGAVAKVPGKIGPGTQEQAYMPERQTVDRQEIPQLPQPQQSGTVRALSNTEGFPEWMPPGIRAQLLDKLDDRAKTALGIPFEQVKALTGQRKDTADTVKTMADTANTGTKNAQEDRKLELEAIKLAQEYEVQKEKNAIDRQGNQEKQSRAQAALTIDKMIARLAEKEANGTITPGERRALGRLVSVKTYGMNQWGEEEDDGTGASGGSGGGGGGGAATPPPAKASGRPPGVPYTPDLPGSAAGGTPLDNLQMFFRMQQERLNRLQQTSRRLLQQPR